MSYALIEAIERSCIRVSGEVRRFLPPRETVNHRFLLSRVFT